MTKNRFDTTLYDYAINNHVNHTYSLHAAFDVCKKFEDRYVEKYGKRLHITDPEWAYWFAKFIINDHWPAGELLICQDSELVMAYRIMVSFEITVGILGHSLDGIKEVIPAKKEKINLADVADFVDAEMQKFKKQAKVRANEIKELL